MSRHCFVRLSFVILVISTLTSCEKNNTDMVISSPTTTLSDAIQRITPSTPIIKDLHLEGDKLCIINFGDCVDAKDTCSKERALLEGLCEDSPKRLCCAPKQLEKDSWENKDEECMREFGNCMLDVKNCSGTFQNFQCGGPVHRQCCIPDPKDASEWEKGDTICKQSLGTCKLNLLECNGEYQVGTCGGPTQRQCCLPGETVRNEWTKHDDKCHEQWGTCTSTVKACTGKRDKTLCGGPDARQCCIPDKDTMETWKADDKKCMLEFGACQLSSKNCSDKFDDKKCGGPAYRQCCVPDSKRITEWKKLDSMCSDKGGICQSIATPCHQQYQQGYCGGPTQVRQCCLAPLKEGEIIVETVAPEHKDGEKAPVSTAESIIKKLSSNMTLLLSVSIPALLIMIIALYCLIKKHGTCCRPYKKLRHDHKKTPWYKMEYNEMDDDEDVNLTMSEETKTYA